VKAAGYGRSAEPTSRTKLLRKRQESVKAAASDAPYFDGLTAIAANRGSPFAGKGGITWFGYQNVM
jgi:hypothetical protein